MCGLPRGIDHLINSKENNKNPSIINETLAPI